MILRDPECDFIEATFGAVIVRCDLLLSSTELIWSGSGEQFALYLGARDLESAVVFYRSAKKRDCVAALNCALSALREVDREVAP